ncbi:uncharacterized protein ACR2FA_007464 [Aphomia sociella]
MSYNQCNYNFRANSFTFRHNFAPPNYVPSPPPPPLFYVPPRPPFTPPALTDEECVKRFEAISPVTVENKKPNGMSISIVREEMRKLVLILDDIKIKENFLSDNCNSLSDEEWQATIGEIEQLKMNVNDSLANINNLKLDMLKKLITKRSAKRLRLKRQRLERKKEKEDRFKKLEENSRKIDDNLQKIKEDIDKVKQEEESKLQADIVLKEVIRKKSDAKKCLAKLDALLKLRKARQNTVKGRGGNVSERDAEVFIGSIDKLKSLWLQKLTEYDKEEIQLRDKLKQDGDQKLSNVKTEQVADNLVKWREHLFGGELPQADFCGDITRFVNVRSQWDQFVSDNGSPLPVGWVLPMRNS